MDNLASALTGVVSTELNTDPDPNFGTGATQTSTIQREAPDPTIQRRALVTEWADRVRTAREHWERKAFKRMRRCQDIIAGRQWPEYLETPQMEKDERYVANITLRHVHQRTATIYGKNPKIVARRKERMLSTVWDGSITSLQAAMAAAQPAPDALTGLPVATDPNALAIVNDAMQSIQTTQKLERVAKTLQLLYDHDIAEQIVPFKQQMKATVRRTLTCGVAYVKLGYQRVMKLRPEVERQIADMSEKLALIEQLSADVADGEVAPDSAEAEQLRLAIESLRERPDVIVREGLSISYPASNAIIPDTNTTQLRGFVGSGWAAEEYFLTNDQIKRTYNVDVKVGGAKVYAETKDGVYQAANDSKHDGHYCVWEVYSKTDGLVFVLCDGFPDFLENPTNPDVELERFYPWFTLIFNEIDDPTNIFPPSDVSLMYDMQMELNRARQGLREHRRANRPRTVTRKGALEEEDKDAIENCEPNAVVELAGLQPSEKIQDVLQVWEGPEIDPALYDTGPAYEDILRVLGQQEAQFGGTSGATATEVSTADASRMSSVSSNVDDLDEFLCEFARAGGQVLMIETSKTTVVQVVGPGAVWPEMSRDEIAKEIYLDIEAASTGRPNKAQEIQNAQQLMPILMQVPGVNPEWVARELIRRLDDRMDLTDAFASGMPSIMTMNRLNQMAPAGASDPNLQGDEGAANDNTDPGQVNAAPRRPDLSSQAPAAA